jgi:plasmid stability protein
MPVRITIRRVPEKVHATLAARAARAGKSLQAYLLAELERLASAPSPNFHEYGVESKLRT